VEKKPKEDPTGNQLNGFWLKGSFLQNICQIYVDVPLIQSNDQQVFLFSMFGAKDGSNGPQRKEKGGKHHPKNNI
jgi:hypothetical protein